MSKATNTKGLSTPETALTLRRAKILKALDQEKNTQAVVAAVNELVGIDAALKYLQDNSTELTTDPGTGEESFD